MATLGNNRRVYIVTTASATTTYTWLTGEQTNSVDLSSEALETSDKSNGWAQFISGKKGATAEVTVYADDTNAQQQAALKALTTGANVKVFIGTLTGTSTKTPSEGDAFSAVVTAISDTNDNGSVATRSIRLTATGSATHYPTIP